MRKGILVEAAPTSLDRLVPEIRNGHAGKYDTKDSRDPPKDQEHARKDAELGECFGGEDPAIEEKYAQFGEGDGKGKEDLVGPGTLVTISLCGPFHRRSQTLIGALGKGNHRDQYRHTLAKLRSFCGLDRIACLP